MGHHFEFMDHCTPIVSRAFRIPTVPRTALRLLEVKGRWLPIFKIMHGVCIVQGLQAQPHNIACFIGIKFSEKPAAAAMTKPVVRLLPIVTLSELPALK